MSGQVIWEHYVPCRFERWNVTDQMINLAKTEYVTVAGADGGGKREALKKTGPAASITAFLDAHAPGAQVSPVVALQSMIVWGNFKPDSLFVYHVGYTLSATKMLMCDLLPFLCVSIQCHLRCCV